MEARCVTEAEAIARRPRVAPPERALALRPTRTLVSRRMTGDETDGALVNKKLNMELNRKQTGCAT